MSSPKGRRRGAPLRSRQSSRLRRSAASSRARRRSQDWRSDASPPPPIFRRQGTGFSGATGQRVSWEASKVEGLIAKRAGDGESASQAGLQSLIDKVFPNPSRCGPAKRPRKPALSLSNGRSKRRTNRRTGSSFETRSSTSPSGSGGGRRFANQRDGCGDRRVDRKHDETRRHGLNEMMGREDGKPALARSARDLELP